MGFNYTAGFFRPTSNHGQLLVFAIVYGLGYGACFSVLSSRPAKLFGHMPEFSKLNAFSPGLPGVWRLLRDTCHNEAPGDHGKLRAIVPDFRWLRGDRDLALLGIGVLHP